MVPGAEPGTEGGTEGGPELCVPPPPRPGCDCQVCCPLGYDKEAEAERPLSNFRPYKLMKVAADGTRVALKESDLKDLERNHPNICEWTKALSQCQRGWQKECLKVLEKCMKHKMSWPFKEPVDPTALGIPDYPTIIRHPMDLKTIETRFKSGMIQTPDEFVALVRTVFRNAYVYNKPGDPSGVREAAEKLSYIFEKEVQKM